MEIYDIAIAPGQVRDIFCKGGYVYFYSGSAGGADPTITVNQDSRGQRVLLMPGQAYRMPNGETGTRWLLGNLKGQGTIIGRIVIGDGELTDNRVTGSVEVIDGGMNRTMSDEAYLASSAINGVAGQETVFSLYNPAASGKNVIVNSISIGSAVSPVLFMANGTGVPGGTIESPANKRLGSAVSSSAKKYDQNVAVLPANTVMAGFSVTASLMMQISINEPILIEPDKKLMFYTSAPNQDLKIYIEFFERSRT